MTDRFMAKYKSKPFYVLFKKIREYTGNYEDARELIGISTGTMDSFEKGKLTRTTGIKILKTYNKIKPHLNG